MSATMHSLATQRSRNERGARIRALCHRIEARRQLNVERREAPSILELLNREGPATLFDVTITDGKTTRTGHGVSATYARTAAGLAEQSHGLLTVAVERHRDRSHLRVIK